MRFKYMSRNSRNRRVRRAATKQRALVVVNNATRPKGRKRQRNRSAGKGATSPYLVARCNPFLSACEGVRCPDEFGYPTGTAIIRSSRTLSANSNTVAVGLFMPWTQKELYVPFAGASRTSITWAGGTGYNSPQNTALSSLASGYRVVAWGIRITADSSLTNSQGHVWISHIPGNYYTNLPYYHAPTSEDQFAACPLSEKFSVTELAQKPIIVTGRPVDDGIFRFRTTDNLVSTATNIESFNGWCNIGVMLVGGIDSVTSLNVEIVMHLEYMQDGDTLYGFIDTIPGAYEPQQLVAASKVDEVMPVGVVETVISGVEQVVDFTGRLVTAGSKLLPQVMGAMKVAGTMARLRGASRGAPSIPTLGWYDDEKYME